MLEYSDLKIYWLGHDSFKIENDIVIYTDPFNIKEGVCADLILITHSHFDHFSPEDIQKISSNSTVVVAPQDCVSGLGDIDLMEIKTIESGKQIDVFGVNVKAVPAYNVNKFRSPGVPFHPRQMGGVGFVFKVDEVTFYHTGDSDFIPEMEELEVDLMFVPVSGTYVMNYIEAAKAVKKVNPKLVIPMHYGSIIGSKIDAQKFNDLSNCRVEILEKEN